MHTLTKNMCNIQLKHTCATAPKLYPKRKEKIVRNIAGTAHKRQKHKTSRSIIHLNKRSTTSSSPLPRVKTYNDVSLVSQVIVKTPIDKL